MAACASARWSATASSRTARRRSSRRAPPRLGGRRRLRGWWSPALRLLLRHGVPRAPPAIPPCTTLPSRLPAGAAVRPERRVPRARLLAVRPHRGGEPEEEPVLVHRLQEHDGHRAGGCWLVVECWACRVRALLGAGTPPGAPPPRERRAAARGCPAVPALAAPRITRPPVATPDPPPPPPDDPPTHPNAARPGLHALRRQAALPGAHGHVHRCGLGQGPAG